MWGYGSHPSRGAWIEIRETQEQWFDKLSHPSRGAWIEIIVSGEHLNTEHVAPLTGCVD